MSDYYTQHKTELNYKTKLRYNIRKFPFVENLDDAEFWILVRKYVKPFAKVLDETEDIDKITGFLKHYLEYSLSQKQLNSGSHKIEPETNM